MQLIYPIDIFEDNYNIIRDRFETHSVNVMKNRPLVAKKARHKIFVLYLRKVSLIKYIRYKNIQTECGEPFYKKVACLHDILFISQHFDWVLCIISEFDWINNF